MADIPDWEAKYWANRLQQKATGNNQISQPNHHEPLDGGDFIYSNEIRSDK